MNSPYTIIKSRSQIGEQSAIHIQSIPCSVQVLRKTEDIGIENKRRRFGLLSLRITKVDQASL